MAARSLSHLALSLMFALDAVSAASITSNLTESSVPATSKPSVTVQFSYQPPTPTASCSGDTASYCPRCDGSSIRWGEFGNWVVYCGRLFSEATYYENMQDATVSQCISICLESDVCDSPVISPDGECILAKLDRDGSGQPNEDWVEEAGWAVLLPGYTGAVPVSGSGVESFVYATSSALSTTSAAVGYNSTPTFCNRLDVSCPRCDNAFVEDSMGKIYRVMCDSMWINRGSQQIFDFDLQRCMLQYENTPDCQGVTLTFENKCALAFGDDASIQESGSKNTAFLLNPSNTPTAAPPAATETPDRCQSHAVSCPRCDDSYVRDDLGQLYHVFCDNEIYSEKYRTVKRPLTPAGCLAECDRFDWCKGVNYGSPNICKLARGEDVFPQYRVSQTAFLPVNLSFTPAPPTLSAFPTGDFTSADSPPEPSAFPTGDLTSARSSSRPQSHQSTSATRTSTSTEASSPAASAEPCGLNNVVCRQCDGASVVDSQDNTYRVQCNFEPICNKITGRTRQTSQDSCMQHCDGDELCLAAIWYNGQCSLCEGSFEGLATYQSPSGYVVFVAEGASETPKPTSSGRPTLWSSQASGILTPSSTKASTSSRCRTTQISTITLSPVPRPLTDIGSVQCPADDDWAAVDPTNRRHFNIQCGVGLGAAEKHFVSASNIAACAASCTDDCNGFQLAYRTRCGLFTLISVVSSKPGATAGIHITNPPSASVSSLATVISANEAPRLQ